MRSVFILIFAVLLSSTALAGKRKLRPVPAGSIGIHHNGCLNSDTQLTGQENGLLKIFLERDRAFGNPVLLATLTSLGHEYRKKYQWPYESIQLGDMAQRWGGPVGRHDSHQSGLDADVIYLRNDLRETGPRRGRDASFDESFVSKGKVTANFDGERNWWVLFWLLKNSDLDRVFVDVAIKKYFCENAEAFEPHDAQARTELLRRLRPLALHDDHFHMRLKCPRGDVKCKDNPKEPPRGDGCALLQFNGHENEEIEAEMLEASDASRATLPVPNTPALKPKPIPGDWPKECRQLRREQLRRALLF